jgi:hypothetical protein
MIIEKWKNVPNYEGHYMISNLGNVKSIKFGCDKFLKPVINDKGYLVVNFSKNGKSQVCKIHQLVAMTFLKHTPDKTHKIVVDHINNVKTDNTLENLQLITQRKNSSKDRNGSSQYTGVTWFAKKNKWAARIYINGKLNHIGIFLNEIDASNAYQLALSRII